MIEFDSTLVDTGVAQIRTRYRLQKWGKPGLFVADRSFVNDDIGDVGSPIGELLSLANNDTSGVEKVAVTPYSVTIYGPTVDCNYAAKLFREACKQADILTCEIAWDDGE